MNRSLLRNQGDWSALSNFASRIDFELKRAERYRIFVSLVVFNLGPILESISGNGMDKEELREKFVAALGGVIRGSIREIDAVSNSGRPRIGLLFPETPRQGAEAAVRRLSEMVNNFCNDYFNNPAEYLIPVEISSFPDAAGARPIASYLEEFAETN